MSRSQIISILSRRYFVAGAIFLITLWCITFNSGTSLDSLDSRIGGFTKAGQQLNDGWLSQEQFVTKALENDIYVQEYNGTAVRKLCSEASWRNDVVASCDKVAGGIGNLKINLLACLRYTIESGGTLDFLNDD